MGSRISEDPSNYRGSSNLEEREGRFFFFFWFGVLLLLLLLGFFCSPSFDKDLVLVWRIRSIVFLFESCNLLILV